jgi:hypothetical protein
MIDVSGIKIRELYTHRVGNRLRSEELAYSESPEKLSAADLGILTQFLFGHSDRLNTFKFDHSIDEKLNAISTVVQSVAKSPKALGKASQEIAAHLYSVSNHPKVKAGNLFVGIFDEILFEGKPRTVLGIFKSDTLSPFVKVETSKGRNSLDIDHGAAITSLDKMALVVFSPKGQILTVLSACARGDDAVYWNEHFLQVVTTSSPKAKTKAYLDACRAFASREDNDLSEAERALFLNRSLQYFESEVRFEEKQFSSVFSNKTQEKAFSKFKADSGVDGEDEEVSDFAIEKTVVRKERAKFERNLRLDCHIEIRLKFKDQKEMEKRVEQGFDETKGLPFFKLYYTAD